MSEEQFFSDYFHLIDDDGQLQTGDIAFSTRDETLFRILNLLNGSSNASSSYRVLAKEKFIATVAFIFEWICSISVIIGFLGVVFEDVRWINLDVIKLLCQNLPENGFAVVYAVCSVVVFIQVFAIVMITMSLKSRHIQSNIFTAALKHSIYFTMLVMYPVILQMFFVPFNNESYENYSKNSGDEWNVLRYILVIVSAVLIPCMFIGSLFCRLLLLDPDPSSQRPLAIPHARVEMISVGCKTLVIGLITFFQFTEPWIACLGCIVVSFTNMVLLILRPSFYNQWINRILTGGKGGNVWFLFVACFRLSGDWIVETDLQMVTWTILPLCAILLVHMSDVRINFFTSALTVLSHQTFRIGARHQWDNQNSDLQKGKNLLRLNSEVQACLMGLGVSSVLFRSTFFMTDVELMFRPFRNLALCKDSGLKKKLLFIGRLHLTDKIIGNSNSSMVAIMYAFYLWFFTQNITDTTTCLRAAMGRQPPLDVRYMVHMLLRHCEAFKQVFVAAANSSDVGRQIDFRTHHESALGWHNKSLRALRHMWRTLSKNHELTHHRQISHSVREAVELISRTDRTYSVLVKKFPYSRQAFLDYACFKREIANDEHTAQKLLNKAKAIAMKDNSADAQSASGASSSGMNSSILSSSMHNEEYSTDWRKDARYLLTEKQSYMKLKNLIRIFVLSFMTLVLVVSSYSWKQVEDVDSSVDVMVDTGHLLLSTSDMSFRLAGMYLYSSNGEEDLYKNRAASFLEDVEYFKVTSVNLYKNSMGTGIHDKFTDAVYTVDVMGLDGEAEQRNVDFGELSTIMTTNLRAIAGLSFADFKNREDLFAWGTIRGHILTTLPQAAMDILSAQEIVAESTIDDTIDTFVYADVGITLVCIVLIAVLAKHIQVGLRLFNLTVPAYTVVALQLPPKLIRDVYQQILASKEIGIDQEAKKMYEPTIGVDEEKFHQESDINSEVNLDALRRIGTGGISTDEGSMSSRRTGQSSFMRHNHSFQLRHAASQFSNFSATEESLRDFDEESNAQFGNVKSFRVVKPTVFGRSKPRSSAFERGDNFLKTDQGINSGMFTFLRNSGMGICVRKGWNRFLSGYSLALASTLFMTVVAFCIVSTSLLMSGMNDFKNHTREIQGAVIVRHQLSEASVLLNEAASGENVLVEKNDAIERTIKATNEMMLWWNGIMFADPSLANTTFNGAAFRTDERKNLLFKTTCLRKDNTCTPDRFPFYKFGEYGLNHYINFCSLTLVEQAEMAKTWPVQTITIDTQPSVWFILQSARQDLGDALETMMDQFVDDKKVHFDSIMLFLEVLMLMSAIYSGLIYFLTNCTLLRPLQRQHRTTHYFLMLCPERLVEMTPFIQRFCYNRSNED